MTPVTAGRVWFLTANAMPVRSDTRRIPAGATHSAREGDALWSPLEGRHGDPGGKVGRSGVETEKTPHVASWAILEASQP